MKRKRRKSKEWGKGEIMSREYMSSSVFPHDNFSEESVDWFLIMDFLIDYSQMNDEQLSK